MALPMAAAAVPTLVNGGKAAVNVISKIPGFLDSLQKNNPTLFTALNGTVAKVSGGANANMVAAVAAKNADGLMASALLQNMLRAGVGVDDIVTNLRGVPRREIEALQAQVTSFMNAEVAATNTSNRTPIPGDVSPQTAMDVTVARIASAKQILAVASTDQLRELLVFFNTVTPDEIDAAVLSESTRKRRL